MQTYKELKELAVMCAYNARTSTSTPVAIELWNMAKEYQRRAAQLGSLPDIGDPPPTIQTFTTFSDVRTLMLERAPRHQQHAHDS